MRDAMDLLLPKLAKVILNLAKFAVEWKGEPCLAYTHLQPGTCLQLCLRCFCTFAKSTACNSPVDHSREAGSSMGSRSHV